MKTKFDKVFAQQYFNDLLIKHNITIEKYSAGSCGYATYRTRSIKVPHPTNLDRFGVCLHEIKHILDGKGGREYEKEFACDKYVLDTFIELGYDTTKWEQRMRWHCLSRLAMAHNRGAHLLTMKQEIKDFFKEVDFKLWTGKKIFVSYDKTRAVGYNIKYTMDYSKDEVEGFLNRKGLMLTKSWADDSTYGQWMVLGNGDKYGPTFSNLTEIIDHYNIQ